MLSRTLILDKNDGLLKTCNGCCLCQRMPLKELGDCVHEYIEPYGYSVILCRNCNRHYGAGLVSESSYPPRHDEANVEDDLNKNRVYLFD